MPTLKPDGPQNREAMPFGLRDPREVARSSLSADLATGLAAVYVAAGKLGLAFAFVNPSSTPLWAPTGIALAAFLLFGYRVWPAIFIGAFIVNLTTAGSIATSLGIAAGNTLEGIAGAYLINRYASGRRFFDSARDIFKFAVLAGVASTMVSATIGVTSLALGGYARWADYGPIWLTWWLGDASGDLLIGPLIVLWGEQFGIGNLRGRMAELALLMGTTVAVGMLVFGGVLPAGMRNYPLEFLCVPMLIWAAFRFGQRETASAVAVLSGIAAWGTLRGLGPFSLGTPNESLLLLQTFMATMAVMSVPVAASVWERKRAEAEAVGARKVAETANQAKDEFLAMLGHELRNPLGAITSAVYVLDNAGGDALREARARSIITRQVAHLVRLVEDLLDLTRLSTGRIVLRPRPMNLADCVSDCVEAIKVKENRHDIRAETEPLWVDADPDRIAQIVGNLLSNAIRFTPAGGAIRLALTQDGGWAVMRIEDNGAGIAPALLPHLFELFAADGSFAAGSTRGLGIGLPLMHRLVKLHGGTVEASSDGPGQGSIFTVHLPLIAQPQSARVAGQR